MCSKDEALSYKSAKGKPKLSKDFSESGPLAGNYYVKTLRGGNVVNLPNDAEAISLKKVKNVNAVLGIKKATPRRGARKRKNVTSQSKNKRLTKLSQTTPNKESQASKTPRKKSTNDINCAEEGNALRNDDKHPISFNIAAADSPSRSTQQTLTDGGGDTNEMTLIEFMQKVKGKTKSSPAKPLKDSNKLTTNSTSCDLEIHYSIKNKLFAKDFSTTPSRKRKDLPEKENFKSDAEETPSREKRSRSQKESVKTETDRDLGTKEEETLGSLKEKSTRKVSSQKRVEYESLKSESDEILGAKEEVTLVSLLEKKTKRVRSQNRSGKEIVKIEADKILGPKEEDTLGSLLEKTAKKVSSQRTTSREVQRCAGAQLNNQELHGALDETNPDNCSEKVLFSESSGSSYTTQLDNIEQEPLGCWQEKTTEKVTSQRTSTRLAQRRAGSRSNKQELQGKSDVNNLENFSEKGLSLESSGNSYTAQLHNKELQNKIDCTFSETSTKEVPFSEGSGSSYTGSKLDLADNSLQGVDFQNNATDLMEFDDLESKNHESEPIADSSKHTNGETPKTTEIFASGSELDTCSMSVSSEKNYCVGQHRTFSPGAKTKLFTPRGAVTKDKVNGSFIDKPESNLIDKPESKGLGEYMHGSSHLENAISLCAVGVNNISTEHMDLFATETLDMDHDDHGDAFQQQAAKMPSVRKAADYKCAFTKSTPVGITSQQGESNATDTMNVVSEPCYSHSKDFTFRSPDFKGSGSPYSKRLQVEDFKRAFTKSPIAGNASQQGQSDATDETNVVSEPYDSISKGFSFRSPDANHLESAYSKRLQVEDFRRAFTKSPSAGTSSQEGDPDATIKMNVVSESLDSNLEGFQSPDVKRSGSLYSKRLQVEDFKHAFTKSPSGGSVSQQAELGATNKMNGVSKPFDSTSKVFSFQTSDAKRLGSPGKRLKVEDFKRAFTKSPPTEGMSQQNELEATDKTPLISEPCDTNSKDFAFQNPEVEDFTFQSPDVKDLAFQSPGVTGFRGQSKSSMRRRNSPMLRSKSPQPRILHHVPIVATCPSIQSSPLPQRKLPESSCIISRREEACPSPSIRSILKSPAVVCSTACKCDMCSSIRVRAEKASEFSQHQMRDIEALASNLMRELNLMRTIVEGNLNSEAVKLTVDEMKTAAATALEMEETTKKWIAMMSRDCTRFCQIMKQPFDTRSSLPNDSQKQQRKLIFADEAGKELCHFKIFENEEEEENATNRLKIDFEES